MASDTSGAATTQSPGIASDTSDCPAIRARGALPTALPADFAEVFDAYAAEVSRPGGPLDADTVQVYCSIERLTTDQ